MQPLIIEVALNGGTPKARNVHVPRSPAEITADALACMAAGAAIVHSHIDSLQMTGAAAAVRYLEGWAPVLAARSDAILCATVAFAATPEARFGHYAPLAAAGMRMGSLDPGSVNLASHGADGLPGAQQIVYATSFADIAYLVDLHIAAKLGPSIAIYEPGFLRAVLAYERAGRFAPGALVKFYFGGPYNIFDGQRSNISFGLPPTATALAAYLEMMEGSALPWSVAVFGGDVAGAMNGNTNGDGGMARLAIERGGHVRVGLEDYGGNRTPSNAELVAEVAGLARACGREIATPEQAAAMLHLPLDN